MTKVVVLHGASCGHVERMAAAVAGGSRQPTDQELELALARFRGGHVARIAAKLR